MYFSIIIYRLYLIFLAIENILLYKLVTKMYRIYIKKIVYHLRTNNQFLTYLDMICRVQVTPKREVKSVESSLLLRFGGSRRKTVPFLGDRTTPFCCALHLYNDINLLCKSISSSSPLFHIRRPNLYPGNCLL